MTITYSQQSLRCNFVWASSLMVKEYADINISTEMMNKIIADKFDDEWSETEYDPNSPYMDTYVRDSIFNEVSLFFLSREWPTYSDNIDVNSFIIVLQDAIDKWPNRYSISI